MVNIRTSTPKAVPTATKVNDSSTSSWIVSVMEGVLEIWIVTTLAFVETLANTVVDISVFGVKLAVTVGIA